MLHALLYLLLLAPEADEPPVDHSRAISNAAAEPEIEGPTAPLVEPETPQSVPMQSVPVQSVPVPQVTTPPLADAPRAPSPRRTWAVGAFVDAGYVFNHNRPESHVNRGLVTAPRTGEFTVPLVVGHVRHDPTEQEPWQLELVLQAGSAAAALVAADPLPGGDASQYTGVSVWQHVGRANVGGRIPRLGTEVSAGVLGSPLGYWSLWTKDNWTVSTPWHLNASPYVLMGARILQPVGERVKLHAWVTNGWQTYADVNRVPSYLAGVSAKPIEGLEVGQFVYFGPDDLDPNPRAFRVLSDTWAVYDAGRWGLAGMWNVMRERLTLQAGEPVALYMAGAVSPRVRLWQAHDEQTKWFLAARGEAFWDRDGRIFGVDQVLGSGAIDTDVQLFGHLMVRLEYRYDRSTNRAGYFYRGAAIRNDDPALGREQHSIYLMTTGYFEHWFGTRERTKS